MHSITHPKKHLFEVVTSSGSKFNFIAGSRQDAERWIGKIKERSSMMMSATSNTSLQSEHRLNSASDSVQSCSSFLGRKKFQTSSKGVKDVQRSQRKGRVVEQGLKRYGSMILGGTFAHSGTFGVPLQHCRSSTKFKYVPNIVVVCTDIIEERGLDHQGLYRVPGNTTQVNSLYHELMVSREETIRPEDERWKDVNVVGSLLKLFFRKLPSPLITTELYRPTIEAIRKPTEEERIVCLSEVLNRLPKHHLETFRHIAKHLSRIASREDVNKMNIHNLSIVFGPTLISSREEKETSLMVVDMPDQCLVVEAIVKNVDRLFARKNSEGDDIDLEVKQVINHLESSFSDDDDFFVQPAKSEFDVIFESITENEDGETSPDSNTPATANAFLSVSCTTTNNASNHSSDILSLSNSLAGSTPLSSRGQSPFPDKSNQLNLLGNRNGDILHYKSSQSRASTSGLQDSLDCDWVSEGGRRDFIPIRMAGSFKNRSSERDLTDQAMQHLKKLNLDLRAFKHRLEMEKLEQMQRNVSRERIEREYERTLGEFAVDGTTGLKTAEV